MISVLGNQAQITPKRNQTTKKHFRVKQAGIIYKTD